MKKAKKLISLLLALTMLLSMIPMAMAAETTVNLGRTNLTMPFWKRELRPVFRISAI